MKNIIAIAMVSLLALVTAQVETIQNGTVTFTVDGEALEFYSNITVMGASLSEDIEAATEGTDAEADAIGGFLDSLEGKTFYDATWIANSSNNTVDFNIEAYSPEPGRYSNIVAVSFVVDQESLELVPGESGLSYNSGDGGMFDFYVLEEADVSLTTLEPSGDGTIRVAGTFSGQLIPSEMSDLEDGVVIEGSFSIERAASANEMMGTFFEMLDSQ